MNETLDFGDVISTYSRAQALEDGELVDASQLAREAGVRYPVALTRAAWGHCVALSPAAKRAGNDETGRLWDVLWMMANAVRRRPEGSEVLFELYCVTTDVRASRVRLRAVMGPGDDAAPVLTVMLPEES
jgi:hypothetical protein